MPPTLVHPLWGSRGFGVRLIRSDVGDVTEIPNETLYGPVSLKCPGQLGSNRLEGRDFRFISARQGVSVPIERGIGTIKIPTAVALLRTGVLSNWYGVKST